MMSKLFCLLAIGLALLLSTPLHAAWQSAVNGKMLGKRMPPLHANVNFNVNAPANVQANAYGKPGSVGKGVVLVDFWAPWCTPCLEGVPLLNSLQRDYGPRGLSIVGVARESPADLADFARRTPLSYPVGHDPGGGLFAKLGLRSLPYAVLVDRNGIIVWQGNPSALNRQTIESTLAAPALGALLHF